MACLSMVVLCDPCDWMAPSLLKTDRKVFLQCFSASPSRPCRHVHFDRSVVSEGGSTTSVRGYPPFFCLGVQQQAIPPQCPPPPPPLQRYSLSPSLPSCPLPPPHCSVRPPCRMLPHPDVPSSACCAITHAPPCCIHLFLVLQRSRRKLLPTSQPNWRPRRHLLQVLHPSGGTRPCPINTP